jgi:hypothetical protein
VSRLLFICSNPSRSLRLKENDAVCNKLSAYKKWKHAYHTSIVAKICVLDLWRSREMPNTHYSFRKKDAVARLIGQAPGGCTKENRCFQKKTAVVRMLERKPYQQVLQEDPHELGCMPESTKPCFSWKSMLVFMSMPFARSSRKSFRPFKSMVVSPDWAALAMSIANEGLQPPGTTKILTPSPAAPCFATTSLNLFIALSVKLTITDFLLAVVLSQPCLRDRIL